MPVVPIICRALLEHFPMSPSTASLVISVLRALIDYSGNPDSVAELLTSGGLACASHILLIFGDPAFVPPPVAPASRQPSQRHVNAQDLVTAVLGFLEVACNSNGRDSTQCVQLALQSNVPEGIAALLAFAQPIFTVECILGVINHLLSSPAGKERFLALPGDVHGTLKRLCRDEAERRRQHRQHRRERAREREYYRYALGAPFGGYGDASDESDNEGGMDLALARKIVQKLQPSKRAVKPKTR